MMAVFNEEMKLASEADGCIQWRSEASQWSWPVKPMVVFNEEVKPASEADVRIQWRSEAGQSYEKNITKLDTGLLLRCRLAFILLLRNDLIVILNLSVLFCKLEYILVDNRVE